MKAYFFNYSHDVQLSSGRVMRNISRNVCSLEYALQPLAVFTAAKGDLVVVHPQMVDVCRNFYSQYNFPEIEFVSLVDIPDMPIEPWGWDIGIVNSLKKSSGIHVCLPSLQQLDDIRSLSSRKNVSSCLAQIRKALSGFPLCGESWFCSSENDLQENVVFPVVLKLPWSSSGRGIKIVQSGLDVDLKAWVSHVLRTQGGLEVEPYYHKIADWAMEFYADIDGKVSFTGLSHFMTSPLLNYSGNMVASQDELQRVWRQYMPLEIMEGVKEQLCVVLSTLVKGRYTGNLGVDMMFCKGENDEVLLHPLVEINFRRTMGQIAQQIADRMPQYCPSWFKIIYQDSPANLRSFFEDKTHGEYCLLTPLTEETRFAAYLKPIS